MPKFESIPTFTVQASQLPSIKGTKYQKGKVCKFMLEAEIVDVKGEGESKEVVFRWIALDKLPETPKNNTSQFKQAAADGGDLMIPRTSDMKKMGFLKNDRIQYVRPTTEVTSG